MLDKRINRIKIYFFAISGIVVIALFAAVVGLKDNPYLTKSYLESYITNWKYQFEFSRMKGAALASAALGDGTGTEATEADVENSGSDIPVLVYHGVLKKSDGSGINLTDEQFKNQMFALKQAGYTTITPDQFLRYLRGEIVLPRKSFLLTFDDGRKDSYYNGDPILKTVGYNATMFVISHFPIDLDGTNYYLSKEELQQMQDSGRWDLEAHTYNGHGMIQIDQGGDTGYFFGNKAWLPSEGRLETDQEYAERISEDLAQVKLQLENTYHKQVNSFAFPFGDHGQEATNYPDADQVLIDHASALYPLLYFQYGGGYRFNANYFNIADAAKQSFLVRRIDINPNWSGADIVKVMNNAEPKILPYTDAFATNNGWIASWGLTKIANGSLTITPEEANAGAATVLDGTGGWKDYQAHFVVNAQNQNGVYIWVRFQDDNNNAACNFGNGFAHVEETVNGKENVLQGATNDSIRIPAGDFGVTVKVEGRRLTCTLDNGVSVQSDFLDPSLNQGGIGFKIWEHPNGGSDLTVKRIDATSISDVPVAASKADDPSA
ncbi:MAG TPA: polysaccharide deacetylase family protein [Candidatus Paceibacterota bacterium]|jgi:peptidoglycan/xylan/chitin deacetylase (PgdA/CDA1 family)|nr:polysaccharide deacetylase family protein [Candidatus Paceibacterota bacterium]